MKPNAIALASCLLFTSANAAPPPAGAVFPREAVEWCDIWIPHSNENKLPRVLLLGDSIVRAYRPEVEKRLAGNAYVAQLASSAFVSDPALLAQVAMILTTNKFDIIHFNNGMHGWEHSEEEYAKGLPILIATIRKYAPGAKLIWASTTALRDDAPPAAGGAPKNAAAAENGRLMTQADLKKMSDARIRLRNSLAEQVMKKSQIPITDLYSISVGHPEHHSDNVHFNGTGIGLQAGQVVESIKKQLPNP